MVKSKGKSSPDRQSSTRQKPNISKKSVGSESKYIPVDPRVFKDKIIDKFHPQWAISQLVSPHENSEFSKNMIFVAFFAWMFCPKDKMLRIGLIYRSVFSAWFKSATESRTKNTVGDFISNTTIEDMSKIAAVGFFNPEYICSERELISRLTIGWKNAATIFHILAVMQFHRQLARTGDRRGLKYGPPTLTKAL